MKLRNFSPWSQVSDERAGEVGPLSGIAGIFNRSGQSVDLTAVSLLLSSSAHRSSNGVAEFCESQVGLVQRISIPPDPESAHARGELEHLHGHRVTFHGHLTNKSSLRGRLGSEVGRCLNDASLVLEAYLKWGHDCAVHLEGDFAFAIWDRKAGLLFCARDVLGIKPLHYYLDENLFIFGSEVDDILCHTGVSTELDTGFIASFACDQVQDREGTFFRKIKRLPAAHTHTVTRGSAKIRKYWDPRHISTLKYRSLLTFGSDIKVIFNSNLTSKGT